MHLLAFLVLIVLAFLPGCTSKAVSPAVPAHTLGKTAQETSMSSAESQLADLINDLRTGNGLPAVPVTTSLYLTAKWHISDLIMNAPDKNSFDKRGLPCGMHSWSSAGKGLAVWEALCYTADHHYADGMHKKPREIAGYEGKGYEIIYWKSFPATPEATVEAWKKNKGERAVILEEGVWKNMKWQAMGVRIEGNYAAVWFGDRIDGKGLVARGAGAH